MKATITCIALLLLQAVTAQTLTETQKLEATARIWGFLKYYHPQVAAGKYNWDDKLVELLPKVKQAGTKEELNTLYANWIDGLGNVPVCKKCAKQDKIYFDKNFDLSWMEDSKVFTPQLTAKLKYIENNRLLGKKHYVSNGGDDSATGITNEPVYSDFKYPSVEGRLLTLFRLWNTIEYFAPSKYLTDVKWADVLTLAIPKIINAKDATEYQLALTEVLASSDDSHGTFNTDANKDIYGYYRTPFYTSIVDKKIIVTNLVNDSLTGIDDIRIGDIITHSDGKSVMERFNLNYKYYCASNKAVKNRHIIYALWNNNETATITFERNGVTSQKEIHLYKPGFIKPTVSSKGYKVLDGNIGYAKLNEVYLKDIDEMMTSFAKCPAIIFDIRNYPQWIVHELCARLSSQKKEFVTYVTADLDYPGRFVWQPSFKTKSGRNPYKGKIIILVNEFTQSRAEFTTMALKAATDATIVGSQTAGADGELVYVPIPGEFTATFTGNGIFYPDWRETQRIGIVPNVEVHPTIAGIQAGKDEVLDKAIEIANQ